MVSVIYENERVLVTTQDGSLPIIEIEDVYSASNINNDFHFLTKVSIFSETSLFFGFFLLLLICLLA